MKRIIAILVCAVIAISAMCISVSAYDMENQTLLIQFYTMSESNYAWAECKSTGEHADANGNFYLPLGEEWTLVWNDFSGFKGLPDTHHIQHDLQLVDKTLNADGETSTITYTLSDMVIKADGYADLVVPCAGTYTYDLKAYSESWGQEGDKVHLGLDVSSVAGSTPAELAAYFNAVTEATITVSYDYYGEVPAEETPADVEPVEDTPAEETPAEETKDEEPAETGIALAVLPMAVAMAVAVLTKKR